MPTTPELTVEQMKDDPQAFVLTANQNIIGVRSWQSVAWTCGINPDDWKGPSYDALMLDKLKRSAPLKSIRAWCRKSGVGWTTGNISILDVTYAEPQHVMALSGYNSIKIRFLNANHAMRFKLAFV